MTIRLNLLAEAQAAEELRRRDPVKRALWIAGLLVSLMLVWSSSLQLKALLARGELTQVEARVQSHTNEYQVVIDNQKKAADTAQKLTALKQLATNRFLNGNLFNALQRSTVEDIKLVRLKVDQIYSTIEEVKPKTNGDRILPGKPAQITERIVVTLDGKDSSPSPGDQINKFRDALTTNPYFSSILGKTNEIRLSKYSSPQSIPGEPPFVSFTFECIYPSKTR